MRRRWTALIAGVSLSLLSACGDGGPGRISRPVVVTTAPTTTTGLAPTTTVAEKSAALEGYCRHVLETEEFVKATDEGRYADQDDRVANRRLFEIEALLSADAADLRREGREVEANSVASHSAVLRHYFNAWVGRGPNPGQDIVQDYYRASSKARSMCD